VLDGVGVHAVPVLSRSAGDPTLPARHTVVTGVDHGTVPRVRSRIGR